MKTVITSFSILKAPEGLRISYTCSKIDDVGNIVENNTRKSFAVIDEEFKSNLTDIEKYILNREAAQ